MSSCYPVARRTAWLILLLVGEVRNISDNDGEYRIVGEGGVIKVEVGSTLHLDCPVTQLSERPGTVMLWKKGHRVLTAGGIKVRRDPRMSLVGTDLTITQAGVHDGGLYRCEVEQDTDQPLAVVHTVEILVPPRVQPEPPNGEIVVRSGASVSLECKVNGNPRPSVEWSRAREVGDINTVQHSLNNQGSVLTLHSVTRAASGLYLCRAWNGVGEPATDKINLHVLYTPHVHAVHHLVEGGAGHETTLLCLVHAEPTAEVVWYKNNMRLDLKRGYVTSQEGRRHRLTIPEVGEEDFANYSCEATNSLGKSRAAIQLRGNPRPPVTESKVKFVSRNCYRVSWSTTSYQQIVQYRVQWRKAGTYSALLSPNWMSHVFPGPGEGGLDPVKGSWDIKGLEEGQGFEVRLQAKNRYGWSDYSETLYFFTEPVVESSQRSYLDQFNINLKVSSSSGCGPRPVYQTIFILFVMIGIPGKIVWC